MPIYEYECQKCGAHSEEIQKITDQPLKKCKNSGCKGKLRRLVSNSSFVLKGSGWYVTDYPSQERKKGMESESKEKNPKKDKDKKKGTETKASGNGKKSTETKPTKDKAVSTK